MDDAGVQMVPDDDEEIEDEWIDAASQSEGDATASALQITQQFRVCTILLGALFVLISMVWCSWRTYGSSITNRKLGIETQRSDTPQTAATREALRKRR
mmetsp:Transcript_60985/g.135891  ORF Transcript_60985/g.135891 Transcript_60985/m.135891 type:complete len:99 (+) Transcript_60985:41-337(+)